MDTDRSPHSIQGLLQLRISPASSDSADVLNECDECVGVGNDHPRKSAEVCSKNGARRLVIVDLLAELGHESGGSERLAPHLGWDKANEEIEGGENSLGGLSFGELQRRLESLGDLSAVGLARGGMGQREYLTDESFESFDIHTCINRLPSSSM